MASMADQPITRRRLLALVPALLLGAGVRARPAHAHATGRARAKHPDPRPGIDASNVVPADRVGDPAVAPIFDMVREIPQVVDGIRCYCGCADIPDKYSLLSCYEADGMAQVCKICQGQARLAHRLHKAGKSLAEIRDAIDDEFGG
jgi:hypothetical protein